MVLNELHLEITRNCTLHCEHCLRGDKECVNMSLDTLNNVFKDIEKIDTLLLTGGEPLIAINQLEKLVEIIKSKEIKIGTIRLITNGTIMSARVLRVLKEFANIAIFDIKVSDNIFHTLELERLGFTELRNKNFTILKECLGAVEYGSEDKEEDLNLKCMVYQMLTAKGRASTIAPERLAEINELVSRPYVTDKEFNISSDDYKIVHIMNGTIEGPISIDVNGNLVGYGREFKEEDSDALLIQANINEISLEEAVNRYIQFKDSYSAEQKRLKKING